MTAYFFFLKREREKSDLAILSAKMEEHIFKQVAGF